MTGTTVATACQIGLRPAGSGAARCPSPIAETATQAPSSSTISSGKLIVSGAAISAKSVGQRVDRARSWHREQQHREEAAEGADDHALDHERPADEPVGRADELHHLDLAPAREERQPDRVGDQQRSRRSPAAPASSAIVSFTTRVTERILFVSSSRLRHLVDRRVDGRALRRRGRSARASRVTLAMSSGSSGVTRNDRRQRVACRAAS